MNLLKTSGLVLLPRRYVSFGNVESIRDKKFCAQEKLYRLKKLYLPETKPEEFNLPPDLPKAEFLPIRAKLMDIVFQAKKSINLKEIKIELSNWEGLKGLEFPEESIIKQLLVLKNNKFIVMAYGPDDIYYYKQVSRFERSKLRRQGILPPLTTPQQAEKIYKIPASIKKN